MAIEEYKECEIEHDGFGFTWCHPDYDGPDDVDDINYRPVLCGRESTIKDCYLAIDELEHELDAEREMKKEMLEAAMEDADEEARFERKMQFIEGIE